MKVLLGVTGGIAAYKAPDLLRRFQKAGCQVAVALTPSARNFVSELVLRTLADHTVMGDIFSGEAKGVGHVGLADWPDVLVVAPATAQSVARFAGGLADEPVSLCFLATRAPRIVFPAMNLNMWANAATQANVATLRTRGIVVVDPESGELACGWQGSGRLPDLDRIVELTTAAVHRGGDLTGVRVVVTAGPTREHVDPVRFLSNPSTGKMGFAVAERAAARGAQVVLVTGPVALPTPTGVERIDVVSAIEMRDTVFRAFEQRPADVFVAAAAVADYRPVRVSKQKIKKREGDETIELTRTPDILVEVSQRFRPAVRVGFAAETEKVVDNAREKLARKDLTIIVANDVTASNAGFGSETNLVTILDRDGGEIRVGPAPKREVADRLLDAVKTALGRASAKT